jgi:mannosyltransferase
MGNDEVVSRYAAGLSLGQLVQLLRRVDIVHGLYYLMLHGWMAVGTSPAVLRIPSVIATVAAAALMVILARRLTGSGWAALFAGLIMVVTPSTSYYAQTARSYALVCACVLADTLALLSALQAERANAPSDRNTRQWLIYAALVALSAYLNEMALLVLPAHAITVFLTRYGRLTVRRWAVASAMACVLAAPVVIISILQRGYASYIGTPNWQQVDLLYQISLARSPRWPGCWWHVPSWLCCPAHGGGGGTVRARGLTRSLHLDGGAVAGCPWPRWRCRCSWSRPASCSRNHAFCIRCSSSDMSNTARPG